MKRRLNFALRCVVSIALITVVARKVHWRELGEILSRLDLRFAAVGWALGGVMIAGLALRWHILLRQQGLQFPFATIFSLTWAGQFFNSILPGSTGGDLVKVYQLCRLAPARKAHAVATILIDRLSALFALLVLATIGFLLQPAPLRLLAGDRISERSVLVFFVAAGIAGLAVVWLVFRAFRGARWLTAIQRTLLAARTHLVIGPQLLAVALLAFAVHLINFSIIYLFARALDITITYPAVLLMMPVILFVVLIPITINGHGIRELLLIAYFTELGVHVSGRAEVGYNEAAIALSLLIVASDLIWSLPGGLGYLMRFRAPRGVAVIAPAPQ